MTPVVLLMGDAAVLIDRELLRIEQEVLPECGLPAFNHGTWRATDDNPIEAIRTARTLPMMAGKRLVVLRDLHEGKSSLLEAVADYVSAPSDTTVLVLTASKFGRVRKGSKDWGARIRNAAKKSGKVVSFDSSKTNPVRFAREHAETAGLPLEPAAAEMLVAIVGSDLGTIAREVEKVVLYAAGGERVTPDHVAQACSALAEQDAWALSGAIATGDAARAVAVLQPLLERDASGGHIRMILGQLGWQLRQVATVSEGLALGRSDKEIGVAVKGYGKWELIRAARKAHGRGELKSASTIVSSLAVANQRMNSHRAGDRRILEDLVLELCG